MKLFLNRVRTVFVLILVFIALIPFNNCSKEGSLTLNKKSLSSTSSSSSTPDPVVPGAPVLSFTSKIPDLVNMSSVSSSFDIQLNGGVLSSITCQLNVQPAVNCSAKNVSFIGLADGDYTLKIVATLTSGLSSELSSSFRKDSTAPVINVSMTPASVSGMNSASFIFNVSDALSGVNTIECALDAGAYTACVSPYNLMNLAAGAHQVKIRASDKANNMSSVYSYSWNIDTSVPTVTISAKPNSVTNMNSASFSFVSGSTGASFQCKLDGAALANCTSPISYTALASQSHTFTVQAKDMLGNFSALTTYTWVVDTVAPTLPVITSSAAALTNQKNVSISFSSTDALSGVASYQCSQNGGAYTNCTSPLNLTALTDGAYSINVRALDQAGNMSAVASASFTVDSVLPVLAFTQSPVSSTAVTATFAFSSSDAGSGIQSVECSLDNAAFAVCVSPINLANLSVAAHNYRVQVKDKAGNMSLLSHNWTVSAVTPPPPPATGMKSIFMSSGHGGRTLMSCDDGLSWINDRADVGVDVGDHSASASRGMASSNGYFYANFGWGYDGTLRRSRDGINWTIIHDKNWGGGIAAFTDMIFHGAEGGSWYTSTNFGASWVQINNSTIGNIPDKFDHPSIIGLNNKIFVSDRAGSVGVSYDKGKTWKLITTGFLGNSSDRPYAEGNGIIISAGRDYSVGAGRGSISRSVDNGLTWSAYKLGFEWSQLVFNGTQFVGWSEDKVWKSSDGLNWTSVAVKIDGKIPNSFEAATQYNPATGTYVAINNGWQQENANQKAYRSKDGENWTTLDSAKFKGGNHILTIIVGDIEAKYCP